MAKLEEAQSILKALGLPHAQQNEMAALTLLALCELYEEDSWKNAQQPSLTISKGIMKFVAEAYHKEYAPNTRETFRRNVLHQFLQARIVNYNPDDPSLPTNSPHAHYALSSEALKVIKSYGSRLWKKNVQGFIENHGRLEQAYKGSRIRNKLPVQLPDGIEIVLSPGKHNKLQVLIIEEFWSRFAPEAKVVYIGDTTDKLALVDREGLAALGIQLTGHEKLPDIILYDSSKNWLFLIEAVTSDGPMTSKRLQELSASFKKSNAGYVFVTAFLNFQDFHRFGKEIAWETEIWIAEHPDHLIHYNGDRFLGPRT